MDSVQCLAVWRGVLLQRRGLGLVNGDVLGDQVFSLHPVFPRPSADQYGEVDASERLGLVARRHHTCNATPSVEHYGSRTGATGWHEAKR